MIGICWRAPRSSLFALITWKRNLRICVVLLAVGFFCTRGMCQSASETTGSFRFNAGRIEASSPAQLALHGEASGQEASPAGLQLSLQQAIRMALENNLDIRLEQIDQSVADFSVTRTEGGAVPRSINYTIAETPAGEVVAPFPLLASTPSTLSPNAINPSGISIPSSYDCRACSGGTTLFVDCDGTVFAGCSCTSFRPQCAWAIRLDSERSKQCTRDFRFHYRRRYNNYE